MATKIVSVERARVVVIPPGTEDWETGTYKYPGNHQFMVEADALQVSVVSSTWGELSTLVPLGHWKGTVTKQDKAEDGDWEWISDPLMSETEWRPQIEELIQIRIDELKKEQLETVDVVDSALSVVE